MFYFRACRKQKVPPPDGASRRVAGRGEACDNVAAVSSGGGRQCVTLLPQSIQWGIGEFRIVPRQLSLDDVDAP